MICSLPYGYKPENFIKDYWDTNPIAYFIKAEVD